MAGSRRMEILNLWLPLIGGGLFCSVAIGAWFANQKIVGIWFGFAGILCLLLLAAIQLHESVLLSRSAEDDPQIVHG